MTPEQIKNVDIGDTVEVKPNAIREGWYRGIVNLVTRERETVEDPVFTTIEVYVPDMNQPYRFCGPMLTMQVRPITPERELDATRAELASVRAQLVARTKDADAYRAGMDERLAQVKALEARLQAAEFERDEIKVAGARLVERLDKAETMLDGARKALAKYFGRTCEDIVPEVKHAIVQLAEAREQCQAHADKLYKMSAERDAKPTDMYRELREALGVNLTWPSCIERVKRIEKEHADFIRGVLKGLDIEGGEQGIDEVALLHRIKGVKENVDALDKEMTRLAGEVDKANTTARRAHHVLSNAKIEHDRSGDGSFLTRMQWLVEERDGLKTALDIANSRVRDLVTGLVGALRLEAGAYEDAKLVDLAKNMTDSLEGALKEAAAERKNRHTAQAESNRLRGEVDHYRKLARVINGAFRVSGWSMTASIVRWPERHVTLKLVPDTILSALAPHTVEAQQVQVTIKVDDQFHRLATEFAPKVTVAPQDPDALEARNILAVALDKLDGEHSTSLVDCAKRAVEYLVPRFVPEDNIDGMIGRLDRILSEFLLAADVPADEADRQTLKHHADDLIGVGNAALERLKKGK